MPELLVVTPPGPESDTLCANLKERGFLVHVAGNGVAAVERASRLGPDVILMDPALSAMDRWHAVKRLNSDPATSAIPVLTLASDASSPAGLQRVLAKIERTLSGRPALVVADARAGEPAAPAAASAEDETVTPSPAPTASSAPRREAASPGPEAVGFAPPPVQAPASENPETTDESASEEVARIAAGSGAAGGEVARRAGRRSADSGTILVVDDNALNRDMLSRRLSRRGYEVAVAEDGHRALTQLAARRFDLVLLDWMMPGLSGIDVLKRIREQFSAVELPVIMATAKTEAEDIVEALKQDANDYVTKPLNFDVVNARIRTQLRLVHAHRQLRQSEQQYRALLENTGDMIVQYRLDGTITYVSPAVRTLLGVEPDRFKERNLYTWLHPIDRRELESQQRSQPGLPLAYTYIARMQRADKAYLWVEVSCRVVPDGAGRVVHAACRDVTEHMERLTGDEPPLPLGGDIMAHPGWRGGHRQSDPAAGRAAEPIPVVLLTLLEGPDAQLAKHGSAAAVSEALTRKLLALLESGDA